MAPKSAGTPSDTYCVIISKSAEKVAVTSPVVCDRIVPSGRRWMCSSVMTRASPVARNVLIHAKWLLANQTPNWPMIDSTVTPAAIQASVTVSASMRSWSTTQTRRTTGIPANIACRNRSPIASFRSRLRELRRRHTVETAPV